MDIDDDDAFLYGNQSPPATSTSPADPILPARPSLSLNQTKAKLILTKLQKMNPSPPHRASRMVSAHQWPRTSRSHNSLTDVELIHFLFSSLVAYGIDPTSAIASAAENPEDGGVEEEDPEDEDSDDEDEDDVKLVFSTQGQRLDLR